MLVAGEPFSHLRDLLLLLFDEGAKMLDRLPRVLGGDAGAVAVVAAPAGGGEVRGLPEQLRRLRARDQMVDGCCVAGAARPLDLAHVPVVGEHGAAELLPARGAVAAITHQSKIAGPSSRPRSCCDELAVSLLGEAALDEPLIDTRWVRVRFLGCCRRGEAAFPVAAFGGSPALPAPPLAAQLPRTARPRWRRGPRPLFGMSEGLCCFPQSKLDSTIAER
jgi:hypothetical protein